MRGSGKMRRKIEKRVKGKNNRIVSERAEASGEGRVRKSRGEKKRNRFID